MRAFREPKPLNRSSRSATRGASNQASSPSSSRLERDAEAQAKRLSGRRAGTQSPAHDARAIDDASSSGTHPGEGRGRGPSGKLLPGFRVHTGPGANEAAEIFRARAFTIGRDIYFGRGEYSPSTLRGQELLAHELEHVWQQSKDPGRPRIQRQAIPIDLQTSVILADLTDDELQVRLKWILDTVALIGPASPDAPLLLEESGQVAVEIARRVALAAGRTFPQTAIDRLQAYFLRNAQSASPESCIAAMNHGIRDLFNDPKQAVSSQVDWTMGKLQQSGRADPPRVIEFLDSRDRLTTGTRRPVRLQESVWEVILSLSGGDIGWSVFGMSIMDGYHSVTLTLDNGGLGPPSVFWSDQWSTRGGWQKFDKAALDAEITRLTQSWWDAKPTGKKPRTRLTLWRLKA